MFNGFWYEFTLLLVAAVVGTVAILPYSLRLLKESNQKKPLKLPLWAILVLSIVQNIVLFAIVIGAGLFASHTLGPGAPLIGAMYLGKISRIFLMHLLGPAFFLGIVAGVALFLGDLLFLPYFPKKLLKTTLQTTLWENFCASFYGGINEELFMRLFGISSALWVFSKMGFQNNLLIFWCVNMVIAVLFAVGHLPALKNLLGTISFPMLVRSLVLNTPIGLLCGWIFWQYGIEAAVLTHFIADIVYHVGGTVVLQWKLKQN